MRVLGIETSCDETAAAIVSDEGGGSICSHVVYSQIAEHKEFGGVVPEIAARSHLELVYPVIQETLNRAGCSLNQVDAWAATCGPGLLGGVMVGALAAKTLAMLTKKPFIAVNHLEGHAQVVCLTNQVRPPYLLLLISGGHCQFLEVHDLGSYTLLGQTLDDSAGETLDKIARLLDLGHPGGPAIERAACTGDSHRFEAPCPLKGRPGCDFSFSGLKTFFRLLIQKMQPLSEQDRADVAASLQESVAKALADRTGHALAIASPAIQTSRMLVVAGGVAANQTFRARLQQVASQAGFQLLVPPPGLCTDNGVMIAWVGLQSALRGRLSDLSFAPRPRWPLEELEKIASSSLGRVYGSVEQKQFYSLQVEKSIKKI